MSSDKRETLKSLKSEQFCCFVFVMLLLTNFYILIMDQASKRFRSSNFTNEEKIVCLNIIKNYRGILECKKTDSVTWKDKENAWNKVEAEFNSLAPGGTIRSKESLRKFYENKKKQTRKLAALEKLNLTQTGGGPSTSKIDDPTFDLTMSILNEKTVFGIENKYDGDNVRHQRKNTEDSVQDEDPIEEFIYITTEAEVSSFFTGILYMFADLFYIDYT